VDLLWSQKTPMLGEHIQQSTMEIRLLSSERFKKHVFVTMDFHE
jgi:hypothetical protein